MSTLILGKIAAIRYYLRKMTVQKVIRGNTLVPIAKNKMNTDVFTKETLRSRKEKIRLMKKKIILEVDALTHPDSFVKSYLRQFKLGST